MTIGTLLLIIVVELAIYVVALHAVFHGMDVNIERDPWLLLGAINILILGGYLLWKYRWILEVKLW